MRYARPALLSAASSLLLFATSGSAEVSSGEVGHPAGCARCSELVHQGPWPIANGFDRQPTQNELRALDQQDVTPAQAQEIDRLYDQLMSGSDQMLKRRPARP